MQAPSEEIEAVKKGRAVLSSQSTMGLSSGAKDRSTFASYDGKPLIVMDDAPAEVEVGGQRYPGQVISVQGSEVAVGIEHDLGESIDEARLTRQRRRGNVRPAHISWNGQSNVWEAQSHSHPSGQGRDENPGLNWGMQIAETGTDHNRPVPPGTNDNSPRVHIFGWRNPIPIRPTRDGMKIAHQFTGGDQVGGKKFFRRSRRDG